MLMETRLRANEMERGGYHVVKETVRGRRLPDLPYY
jgi:hypothetical protein